MRAAFPPLWVQRVSLAPLAWLAKRRGYGARYKAKPAPAIGDLELVGPSPTELS